MGRYMNLCTHQPTTWDVCCNFIMQSSSVYEADRSWTTDNFELYEINNDQWRFNTTSNLT